MNDDSMQLERLHSLAAAAKLLPSGRSNRPTHPSTILRWLLRGCRAPNGERIRLEGQRIGGRWFVKFASIAKFSAALTPQFHDHPAAIRTPGQRQRAAEQAEQKLKNLGI